MNAKYELPYFLNKKIELTQYRRWLERKASAHCKRDRHRHVGISIILSDYKWRIHEAVCKSDGVDWYTGEALRWDLLSKYDNEASKAGRSSYKSEFALLPTVDHVLVAAGAYDFVICGWRTNDAKNDLSFDEFVALCRRVIARHDRS
jgi:hypothetical protein